MIERSMRLSPRDHLIGQRMTRLAEALMFAGRHEEALIWSRRALQQPNIQASRWTTLLAILGNLGRVDEAAPALEALVALDPDHTSDFHPPALPDRRRGLHADLLGRTCESWCTVTIRFDRQTHVSAFENDRFELVPIPCRTTLHFRFWKRERPIGRVEPNGGTISAQDLGAERSEGL